MKTIVLTLTKEQKQFFADTGRIGGQTRAKNMTPERRLENAHKASKAAARARKLKTKANKSATAK